MGVVYAAEHAETGRRVALKTVRLAAEGAVPSLRREILALGRVDHPGVVKIVDEGLSEGMPWYAMELLPGRTLREYNDDIWGTQRPAGICEPPHLPRTLALYRRLCAPLSFLHGQGFVLRDLTPTNVVVRPDGTPVLVDFGLAAQLRAVEGRDRLHVGGSLVGTCAYMAPEQICGETGDARADLYSLGCMLHESLTGEPPFAGGSAVDVLQRHLEDVPVPLSQRGIAVPAELDALLLGLLAKRPSDRIGYASDVAAVLGELGGEAGDGELGPRARGYVYRPRLVGRAHWLRTFDGFLRKLCDGIGALVLLGGESGVGKTRLASEFATRARRAGVRVIVGDCGLVGATGASDVHQTAAALHPFRSFLQEVADVCRGLGPDESEHLLGPRGAVLAVYEASLASVPGQALHADPVTLSGPGARYRVFTVLRETMAALAEKGPVLLVLDDLQWADELSLSFLQSLSSDFLAAHPILIIGVYRSDEAGDRLLDIVHATGAHAITLDRLAREGVGAMMSDMLALSRPPADLLGVVARESEGIPFFVAEYLRAAVDEGLLIRDRAGRWRQPSADAPLDRLPLPGTLQELLERRLAHLPAPTTPFVEMAACLGREFDAELLFALVREDVDGAIAVQQLIQRCVLEESAGGRFRFVHDKLREATYAVIPPEQRRELHRRAAVMLEGWPGDTPRSYPLLAHHWTRAAVPAKAVEYLEKAGGWALASAAYRDAADFFSRALELDPCTPLLPRSGAMLRRARWERHLGEALWGLGDLAGAAPHFDEALRYLERGAPRMRTRRRWAARFAAEALRQSVHLVLPSLRHGRNVDDAAASGEAALAAARQARRHYFAGEALPTLANALAATNLAERSAVELPLAETYWELGYVAGVFRMRRLAEAYFRRAHRCAERTLDPEGVAGALRAEAAYCVGMGRWEQARRAGVAALDLAEAHQDPHEKGMLLAVLAHADFCTGDFALNRQRSMEILGLGRRHANAQYESWGLYTIGRNHLARGELDHAVKYFEEARAIFPHVSDTGSRILCDGLLALACVRRGELERAQAFCESTTALVRDVMPTVFTTGHGYAALAEACLGLWDHRRTEPDRHRAWTACSRLWGYAVLFPIGRPVALVLTARALSLAGLRRAPRWFALRGLAAAEKLAMPLEAATAHAELAWLAPAGSPRRGKHRDEAVRRFAALGCVQPQVEADSSGGRTSWRSRPPPHSARKDAWEPANQSQSTIP